MRFEGQIRPISREFFPVTGGGMCRDTCGVDAPEQYSVKQHDGCTGVPISGEVLVGKARNNKAAPEAGKNPLQGLFYL